MTWLYETFVKAASVHQNQLFGGAPANQMTISVKYVKSHDFELRAL
jgi:hypothetical protein